jgi:hypothetical protein
MMTKCLAGESAGLFLWERSMPHIQRSGSYHSYSSSSTSDAEAFAGLAGLAAVGAIIYGVATGVAWTILSAVFQFFKAWAVSSSQILWTGIQHVPAAFTAASEALVSIAPAAFSILSLPTIFAAACQGAVIGIVVSLFQFLANRGDQAPERGLEAGSPWRQVPVALVVGVGLGLAAAFLGGLSLPSLWDDAVQSPSGLSEALHAWGVFRTGTGSGAGGGGFVGGGPPAMSYFVMLLFLIALVLMFVLAGALAGFLVSGVLSGTSTLLVSGTLWAMAALKFLVCGLGWLLALVLNVFVFLVSFGLIRFALLGRAEAAAHAAAAAILWRTPQETAWQAARRGAKTGTWTGLVTGLAFLILTCVMQVQFTGFWHDRIVTVLSIGITILGMIFAGVLGGNRIHALAEGPLTPSRK